MVNVTRSHGFLNISRSPLKRRATISSRVLANSVRVAFSSSFAGVTNPRVHATIEEVELAIAVRCRLEERGADVVL